MGYQQGSGVNSQGVTKCSSGDVVAAGYTQGAFVSSLTESHSFVVKATRTKALWTIQRGPVAPHGARDCCLACRMLRMLQTAVLNKARVGGPSTVVHRPFGCCPSGAQMDARAARLIGCLCQLSGKFGTPLAKIPQMLKRKAHPLHVRQLNRVTECV